MGTPQLPPKSSWPPYLHLRGKRFYARLRVPPRLGHSSTHLQRSLGTVDYREAIKRLPVCVAELRLELAAMEARVPRAPRPVPVDQDAKWWRERLLKAGAPPGTMPEVLDAEWEAEIERRLGPVVGETDDGEPIYQGEAEASRLAALVYETILPVGDQLDRFLAETNPTPRYADRHRRAVERLRVWLLDRFGTDDLRRVSRRGAGDFVDHLLASGVVAATANSLVSSLKVYWDWMERRLGIEGNPWARQTRKPRPTEAVADKRPFTDDELKRLLNGETYRTLHDLMRVAALSGMRIDEIARLTVGTSAEGLFRVTEGKTANSVREVPVHPDLVEIVDRRRQGKDAEVRLFDELKAPPSRKKELSAKASERFTAYRRALGVDARREGQRQSDVDFHSFRRWFVTKAEMAGQEPHLISAVVGHARDGMTLGVYSGGPSVAQKRAVVESVRLPEGAFVASPEGPIMGQIVVRRRTTGRQRS